MNDMMKNEVERWVSTKEICEHLGVGRDSLMLWINEKELPAHKVGRNWKFKVSEVDEWVRSGKSSE